MKLDEVYVIPAVLESQDISSKKMTWNRCLNKANGPAMWGSKEEDSKQRDPHGWKAASVQYSSEFESYPEASQDQNGLR